MSQPDPFSALAPPPPEPAPPPPPPPPAPWGRKAELEAAMAQAPRDVGLRAEYFDHLTQLAGTQTGLHWALLPEVGAPLWFRAGTPDISAMAHAFRDDGYALPGLTATPLRILMIGAYAGYSAVALARHHPRAHLLCADPMGDNVRLMAMNTLPWRRIRPVQAALWRTPGTLAPLGRYQADWAVRLSDEVLQEDRTIPATTVPDLLGQHGWPNADMVVCDAAGSEREIFANALAPWLRRVDTVLVRSYEQLAPGGAAYIAACFPAEVFGRRPHGGFDLFERRKPYTAMQETPPEVTLIRAEPGGAPFHVQDLQPHGWGFFVFDGTSCQVHPNPPGGPPARVVFPLTLSGQQRFAAGLWHAGPPHSSTVQFTARILREDGGVIGTAQAELRGWKRDRLSFEIPDGARGKAFAMLETAMAEGAANNQMAWARWIDPRIT